MAPGQVVLSTEDLVAAVKVIDEYRPEHRVMYSQLGVLIIAGGIWISPGWSDRGPDAVIDEIMNAFGPYNDSYCQLPDLVLLESAGRGSDFSQIGPCNPKLEQLWINSWPDSTGREGLAGLVNLKELAILGPVDDVTEIPALPSLEKLTIYLANDTPENRQQLAERLPNCKIIYDNLEAKLAFDPTADPPGGT